MTGRQLSALTRRHKHAQDRQQWLVGLLASVTANFSMSRPKEPLTPDDFMPSRHRAPETDEEIAERLNAGLSLFALRSTPPITLIN